MALVSNKLFFGDNDEQMLIGTSFYDSSSIPSYVGIITHPSAAAFDGFGSSVAVGCGRIVVGARFDDIDALTDAGSAHIYDLNGGYVGIITHPSAGGAGLALPAAAFDQFGTSVAVGSGRIVVGAPLANIYVPSPGAVLANAGSAHIYDLNGTLIKSITHPTPATDDQFGTSVAVGSGRIVVGAPVDDLGGVLFNAGSVHIYDLNGGYVGIITHPSAPALADEFGSSVAVGSGRIVVGAYRDDIGIGLTDAGSAHIYDLNGGYVGIITHPSAAAFDGFGYSVAVGSGRIVVGAFLDDIGIGLTNAGSAHIYDLNGNYVGILTHPSAAANDQFGASVAVGSSKIVVGAYLDDIGIGLTNAGSAHIYDLNGNYVGILTHPGAAAFNSGFFSVAVGSGRIVGSGSSSAHIYSIPNQDHILDILDDNK
jgi:hypothetical protein